MPSKFSAVIITKNEEDRIAKCIRSLLPITDDIVVVDSGSEDGTIDLARKLGAQVHTTQWKGYGPTKNWGHTKAKNDWIISIDADEHLSPELAIEIQKLNPELGSVYKMDRHNYYLGKKINHSGWSPDWVFRVFNKKEAKWNESLVHEKLEYPDSCKIKSLQHPLIHHSYRSQKDHEEKIEKYAELRAKIWLDKNNTPNLLKRGLGPFFKGFKSYILKLGFLDGKEGWTLAKMNAKLVKRQIYYFDQLKSSQL